VPAAEVAVLVSPAAGRVGNTAWHGGGLRVGPAADPADGAVDVTVAGRQRLRARRAVGGGHRPLSRAPVIS
jgi:YegS C-terminal NAD kinase beta sandwich-like domain